MKTSLKASLVAAAIATLPSGSHAAGLGPINVFSAIGQPLRAEVELNATSQEMQSLTARIASAEAFRQASLPYSSIMNALKLAVESRGNRAVVRISSDRPLSDPFVDLLIELDWASGRVIREYTFLLDPAPAGTPPAVVAAPVAAPTVAAPSGTQRAAPPSRPPLSDTSAPPARHEVRRGDTLHGIAEAHRPPGASLDQMLVALFQENPDAFEGENINRMRAGAILKVPSGAAVSAVEPAQAHRKVVAQAADFEAYRKRLAGTVAARAAASEPPASRAGAGAIVARVDEPAGQGVGGDQVKVSAPLNPAAAQALAVESSRLARLQSLEEELVARDKALEEANSRLAALEASIREMQQLLEIRSEGLGELQQRAGGSTPDGAGPGASQANEPAAAAPAGVASAPQPAVETQASRPLAEESKPEVPLPAPKAAEVAAPVVEPDFLQGLADDPKLLAAGGGILVLLLGYAGIKVRERRKGEQESRDALGIMSELPLAAGAGFGAAGGQNVNTGDGSILDTDFSQSGLSAIDTDEGVDPVAEADVYMAYGRDAQAEEILLDALKADTSRLAIPLKLLEIYAQRNSLKQFEATASALHSRTGGVGQDWEKAAEMGRRIDPDNPLYGASTAASRTAATELRQGATATDTLPFAAVGAGLGTVAAEAGDTSPDFDQSRDLDFTTYSQDVGDISPADPLSAETESALLKNPWEIPAGETGDKPGADASDITLDATELDPVVFDALPEIDAAALDFDLDVGLPWGGEAAPASADQDAGAAVDSPLPSDPAPNLDFLGEAGGPSAAEALLSATLVSDSGADLPALMPDTHFDLPPDIEEPVPDAGTTDFNLEATKLISGEASGDTSLAAQDPEETTFDSNLLDFDFNFDDASMDSSGVVPALDPSSITLDELLDVPQPAGGTLSDEAIQEVDTKIELARAYEEMGDKEGARELIDEVLREGSLAQREAGKRLLEQLV
ncbi:FimV/HubP family polar landmark protein [Aromatoleum bremense]|uniref:FimV N-terminal domain-containing protein n=1 Tax=Aromatoleum bremense TaxID=76115 RepID=A0ABX1NUX7_9RHOO|nr:FimV/HubP family polar landmark protein [Aromatoleum bremense]NMG15824.1 hypothetical protein [Aromatoleum bremense]QTQ30710.1 Uncharacterized protein pbN1_07180 [Aromatoleum bremense]